MKLNLDPKRSAPRPQAVRAGGVLMLAGGVLAGVTGLVPPAAEGSQAIILVAAGIAAALGAVLLLMRPVASEVGLGVIALLGTALITVSAHEGGLKGGSGDNEILYLWVCLYSFYFLSLRNAFVQLIAVGAAYSWLLSSQTATHQATTQWVVTMTTLGVAGVVVAQLRDSLFRHVAVLSERARRDALTGLHNRGALDERFEIELARSQRDQTPISVLAIDIDEFKPLNDTLGHPTGDKVLRQVSAALQHWTRGVDVAARVGGDEFAVLLPGTDAGEAISVAEDLCSAIARSPWPDGLRVSVSAGVTTSPPGGADFGELWQAADAAMYEAKRSGGDRVCFRALDGQGRPSKAEPAGALVAQP